MQKILFQTVGTGGVNHPVWEALALCVQSDQPDLLIQWCSDKTAEETIPKFNDLFPEGVSAEQKIDICADADDVESLMMRYARQIDEIRERYPQAELAVDYTSGTKAMSAAAVASAVARQIPTLFYGVGPRDATGRASKTDRHIKTPTDQLIAGPLLDELGKLFNLGQFTAVKKQTQQLLDHLLRENADSILKARARTLQFLSQVYDDWDRFNWKSAFATIRDRNNDLNEMLELVQWDTERLTEQLKHLKRCSKERFKSPLRLADLLSNIKRRIAAGYYDDAVCRLYRAIEYIVQCRIAQLLNRATDDKPTSRIEWELVQSVAPEVAKRLENRKSNQGTIDLGLKDGADVLLEVDDPVGRRLALLNNHHLRSQDKQAGRLKNLLNKRNDSWLAHGCDPIGEEDAKELFEIVLGVAELHAEQENFDLQQQLQIATFQQCPWT